MESAGEKAARPVTMGKRPGLRPHTSRIAVVGDVQGHVAALWDGLAAIGVDVEARRLPPELAVVQVGDLVHKGPASEETIDFVDEMLDENPGRWVQLLGNHEAQYLGGPEFWDTVVPDRSVQVMKRWLDGGQARLAVALSTDEGDVLVSHAGLTFQQWRALGSPDAATTAIALNRLLLQNPSAAFRPGSMLRGSIGDAGVVWAEAGSELYRSWAAAETASVDAPFGQIHGHTSVMRWSRHEWGATATAVVRERAHVDHEARHTRVEIAGRYFVGIDPGWGAYAPEKGSPLVLTGTLFG